MPETTNQRCANYVLLAVIVVGLLGLRHPCLASEPVEIGSGRVVLKFAADGRPKSLLADGNELLNERDAVAKRDGDAWSAELPVPSTDQPLFVYATTRKIKDPKWRGPDGAKLVFDVRCPADNVPRVMVVSIGWGAFPDKPWGGTYETRTPIKGSPDWQTISVSLDDLVSTKKDDASTLPSWASVTELTFGWSRTFLEDGKEARGIG